MNNKIKNIVIFGDSQIKSLKLFNDYKINYNIYVYPISGASARGLINKYSIQQSYQKIFNKLKNFSNKNTIVILNFGFVDTNSLYLLKLTLENNSNNLYYKKYIKESINRYIEFIEKIKKKYNNIIIYLPLINPLYNNKELFKKNRKYYFYFSEKFSNKKFDIFYSTYIKQFTLFIKLLINYCKKNNIYIIDTNYKIIKLNKFYDVISTAFYYNNRINHHYMYEIIFYLFIDKLQKIIPININKNEIIKGYINFLKKNNKNNKNKIKNIIKILK